MKLLMLAIVFFLVTGCVYWERGALCDDHEEGEEYSCWQPGGSHGPVYVLPGPYVGPRPDNAPRPFSGPRR